MKNAVTETTLTTAQKSQLAITFLKDRLVKWDNHTRPSIVNHDI